MKHAPLIALLALASRAFATRCVCGYSINKTDAQYFGIFDHVAETDFLHAKSSTAKPNKVSLRIPGISDWDAKVYNQTAEQANKAVGVSYQLGNVIRNALPDGKWRGPPERVGDAGLQLWVRHGLENDLVPVAAIENSRALGYNATSRMLYGSYRAAIKFSGMNGTRGVFGWESKDGTRRQSIKMELSANDTYTIAVSARNTNIEKPDDPDDNTSFATSFVSIVNFPEEFHDYRFDWMPDRVDFYVDQHHMFSQSESIPDMAGTLSLKHYVDDGREDPPAQDAVMTVGYVKAYYNTTTRDEPLPGCTDLRDNVCVVPNQDTPPNPDGPPTYFYSQVSDDDEDKKEDDVVIGGNGYDQPKEAHSSVTSWSASLLASILLVAVGGLL